MLRCPCSNCKNRKVIKEWDVWTHLYLSGFTRSYKIWYHHGETDYEHGSTSEPQPAVRLEEPIRTDVDYGVDESDVIFYSDGEQKSKKRPVFFCWSSVSIAVVKLPGSDDRILSGEEKRLSDFRHVDVP
ncbi:hypothetical protein F2Q70_00037145 [Brassica cretica]|uniref:Transposase-associated domain-containing protein n=1 Tax=Brassica cretica TaxID=69181 RepID=A0A8S9JUQ3_BRACR|nr:hypothetical protein F2Q70_00037145 [Brassica cretica]